MNLQDFPTLWKTKLLVGQFDEILVSVREYLEELKFDKKGIGSPKFYFKHDIYRLRFEFKLESEPKSASVVFYDAGFGFGEKDVWAYVDIILPNRKYEAASVEKIAELLPSYEVNKESEEVRQVVNNRLLKDFTMGEDGSVDKKKVIEWFKDMLDEAQAEHEKISDIIRTERI